MTSMIHALDTSSWYELQTDTDSEDENITIREQLDAGNRYIQQVSTGQQQNLERSFAHSIDFLSRPLNTRGSLFLHLLAEMDDANKKVDQYMNAGKITKESLSDTSDGAMSLQEYPIDTSPRFCETDHSGYDEALSSAIAEVSKDFTSGTLSMQPLISEDNDDSHTSSDNDLLHRGAAYARYPETAAGLSDSDWNPYVTESDTNMSPRIASELQPFGISRSTPDSKISPFNPPLCSTKTGISSSKTPRTSSLIDSGKARNASVHLSQIQEQSEMSINSYSTLKTDSSASPAPLSEYSLSKTSSDLKQVPSRNMSQEADRFRLKTHFERTSWPPNTENVSKITTSLVSEEGKSLGRNIKRDLATKSVLGDLQMKSSHEFDFRSAEERLKNLSHFEDVPKELSTDNTSLLRKGYFTNAVKSTKVDTKTENQMKAFAELYASVDSLQRASKLKYALPSSEEFSLSNSTGPLASSALVQNGDRNAKGMVKSNEVSNPLHIGSYTTFSTRISGETGLPPSEKSSDELSQQVNRLLMETAYLTGSSRAHGKEQSLQTTNMDYVQLHNDLQEIQNSLQNFGQSAIENPSVAKPNTDNDDIVPSTTTTPERGQGRLVWDHAADFGYGQDYIEQFGDMMSDATTTESSPLESRHANSDNIHYTSDGNETQTSGSSVKGPGDEEEQCDGSMIRRTDVDRELNELISAFRSETKALENRYQAVCSQGLADNVSHPVTRTNHDHQDVIADDQCHMMSNYHIDHKLGSSYTNSFTEKRSHNFSFQEDDVVRKRLELSALSDSSDFTSLQNSKLNAHSDLGKEKVLFSATSTAQRLISKQMKKVADRTFNRSIELHSPMHQIVDCYPVYNTQRDQPQYQRLQQELQQQLQYQSHAQVAQQPTLVASSQQQNQQQLLPPPAPPLPSQAQLGHNVQHQTAPEPEESSADTYIAPKVSLTTEVQQNHLDKKLSDEVKNISPDHEKNVSNNSSPADSDKISDRRKGKYRPYRPIGSQDVYYTESDTASVTDSITTVESTHTGSDDAIGPYFPSSILGSRRDTQSLGSSGIYSKHANATGSSKEFLLPTIQERATPDQNDRTNSQDIRLSSTSTRNNFNKNINVSSTTKLPDTIQASIQQSSRAQSDANIALYINPQDDPTSTMTEHKNSDTRLISRSLSFNQGKAENMVKTRSLEHTQDDDKTAVHQGLREISCSWNEKADSVLQLDADSHLDNAHSDRGLLTNVDQLESRVRYKPEWQESRESGSEQVQVEKSLQVSDEVLCQEHCWRPQSSVNLHWKGSNHTVSGHEVQDGDFKSVPQKVTSLTANCQIKDHRSELAKHMGETDVQSTINTQQQQDNANQLQQNSSLTANDQSYGEYPQHSSQTGLQQFLQKSSREQCLQNEEQFAAQTDQGELEDEKELLKRKAVHVDLQDEAQDPRKEDKFCCKVVLESHLETDRVMANPLSKASELKGHHESVQAVRNRDNQSEIKGQTHVYTVRDRDNQNETSGQKHVYTVRERDNQNEIRGQTHVYTVGDRDSQNETRGQTHVYTVGDRDNQNETRGQTHLNTLRDKDNQNITRRQTHLQAFRDRDDQNETRGQTHVHTLRDRDNQNVTRGQTHVHTLRDRDNQNVTRGQTHLQPFRNNRQTELRREMHETEMTFQSRQREAEEAIERAVGIPVKNNDGTVQQNQNKNYKTADIELIQRGQELLQQQELEEKIDQEPISRRAQLLREALEQEQAYRGQPDLQLLWERFSARFNSSTDKDSTLDSERLNTLGELLRDPTHHLVQSFLQQRQVQQIEDRLRAAAQWDVLRQEKRQQMVERNSSKEDLMVKGQEMHWQESKRQQHQQSSGEDSNGSYGEILLQRERERLKRRDAKTLKKKQNRSPSPHSKTVLQQKGSKVPQSRQSNMTDTLETLYSIPEVINSEASPQKPHLSHKFMISNDLIDPNMNKLREKIMKQREKIGLEHVKEQRRVQKLQKLEALLHAKHYGLLDSEVVAAHLNSISSTSITSNDSTVTNGKLAQNYLSEESTTTKDSSTELHMTKATLAHSPSKTLRSKECFIPLERPQDYLESCNSQTDSDFIPRYHLSSQDLRNEHEGKSRKRLHTVDYLSKHGGKFLKLHRTYSPYPKQDEWLWNKKRKSNKVTSPSLISGNISNFESARCKLPTTLSVGQRTRHHRLVSKGVQTSPDYGSKIYSHARGQSLSPLYDDHPVIPVPLVSYHNLPITEQCSERGRNIRPSFERGTFSSLNPGRPRSVSPGRCKSWDESFTHSREQSLSPVRGRSPSPVRSQSSSLVRNRSPSPLELRLQAWTERGKSNLARILQKSDTKNYRKINVASNKGHLGGRANKQWNTIPAHTKTFTDQENQPPNKELHGLKECGLSWFIPLLERKPLQVALQESQVSTALQGEWQSAALSPQKRRELIHKEFLEDKNLIMDGQLEGGAARFYLDRSAAEVEKELGKQYDKFQEKPLCKMSLQEALLSKRPSFVSRLRQRQKRLQLAAEHRRLQALARIERDKIFYEPCRIISNPDAHPYSDNLHQPKKRIFTKQEIREQTEKKYRQLPEVKETEILKKRSEEYRLNRLRAKVFNKRLQRKVLEKMRARACM